MPRPALRACIALIGVLALAACMFSPGKFESTLDLRRDGRFTFGYVGEIHFLALSKLAKAGQDAKTFEPEACHEDETGEERACTGDELAEQRRTWEQEKSARQQREAREAQSMRAMMGDLDMSDPKSGEALAARLRRQAGWRRVEYRGDGLFNVDFQISGTLDHDFAFPTIEQFPLANAFVQLTRRNDGSIRIDAPGFGPSTGMAMMGGMAGALGGSADKDLADLPTPDGRFTLTTDATILANNTDEGPQAGAAGRRLHWEVNTRTRTAPMALLRLSAPTP